MRAVRSATPMYLALASIENSILRISYLNTAKSEIVRPKKSAPKRGACLAEDYRGEISLHYLFVLRTEGLCMAVESFFITARILRETWDWDRGNRNSETECAICT